MEGEYVEYPYRFMIVFLFSLPSFFNGMCWVVVSPISAKVASTYHLTDSMVTLVPMLYMIMYVFANFPSNWILDVKGIRLGVIIGSVLTAVGAGIRCFVNSSFSAVIVGQFLCAVGQPFILNAPAKIATYWFKQQNRPVATAILSSINLIGTGIGFLLPSLIVEENPPDINVTYNQMLTLMLVEFGLCIVGAVLVVIFFRQKPPKLPSLGAQTQKVEFKQSLKQMYGSKNFILLLVGFSFLNGAFNYLGALLNYILKPFGYTDTTTSIFGVILLVVGIIASVVFCLYVQKTQKYKRTFVICAIFSVSAMAMFCFNLYYIQQDFLSYICVVLMGAGLTPLMPLSFDFGCQILFPVGEAQITGILMTGGQIVGIVQILIIQQGVGIYDKWTAFTTSIAMTIVLAVGMIPYFLVYEDLKRKRAEKAKTDQQPMRQVEMSSMVP